jgi:hypothetical protein
LHIPTLRKAPPELGGGLRELRSIDEDLICITPKLRQHGLQRGIEAIQTAGSFV